MSIRFNPNNINLYGTTITDHIFKKHELATKQFEPGAGFKTRRQPLDQDRVNLIKICYLKKVGYIGVVFKKNCEEFAFCNHSI